MTTTSWASGVSGAFNDPTKWTAGVPAAGDTALITATGTYTVISPQFNQVGTLEMAKDATLTINNASSLKVTSGTGSGALAGTINVDGADLDFGTDATPTTFNNTGAIDLQTAPLGGGVLQIAGTVTLAGKGKINLSGGASILSDGNPATLTNGSTSSGNTISGAGTIGDANLSFVNAAKGIIDADAAGNIFIDAKQFTNSGLIEAGNSGSLIFYKSITQASTGKVVAGVGTIMNVDANIVGGSITVDKTAQLLSDGGALESQTKPIANAGEIGNSGAIFIITSAIKNTSTGMLTAIDGLVDISGRVTKGTALIEGAAELEFEAPSSANVGWVSNGGVLFLLDPTQFTGTVETLPSGDAIDLGNIAFAHAKIVSYTKGVLTVTDTSSGVTDKIKIAGGGTFTPSAGINGSTEITDPPANPASVPHTNTNLLAQSMASFGASSGIAGSGTGNLAQNHSSSDFLAANSHHG